jgi:3-phenylpropionate/cinnamic acid dioxygenase small subunit
VIPAAFDTCRYSYHVDGNFYAALLDELGRWDREWDPVDRDTLAQCEDLLFREARLLDESRFEDWTELLTSDCVYWLPITPGGGDPRREVTLAFDDRRRILDRVYWLRTGLAHCQVPPSRTRRMIANVEVAWGTRPSEARVRANFVLYEFRGGHQRALPGWYAHLLRREASGWKIAVKQVNLIDSEHRHENLTVVF